MEELRKTCLHDKHVALGAQMSPFGGFDMPIQYAGIVEEHNAVRNACGVFDVSHMGEVTVKGPEAEKYVNYIFSNNVAGLADGAIFYGMMLNHQGGVVDDLLVYRRGADDFLLVINASNIAKDVAWIEKQAEGFDVEIKNISDEIGEIAVQGPEAEAALEEILDIRCKELTFYTFAETTYGGKPLLVSRTGYTGEDGFEIYSDHETIRTLWDRLMASGKVAPCGLGCRDTLRFEVGLPLYGDELADDISPVEAGLSMFVKLEKPEFIGREVIERQKAEGAPRKLVGLELLDRAIPRHGYEVLNADDQVIGYVTTGYRGISVDKSIAAALVETPYAVKDNELKIRIRRKTFPAKVVAKKFYKKSYKK